MKFFALFKHHMVIYQFLLTSCRLLARCCQNWMESSLAWLSVCPPQMYQWSTLQYDLRRVDHMMMWRLQSSKTFLYKQYLKFHTMNVFSVQWCQSYYIHVALYWELFWILLGCFCRAASEGSMYGILGYTEDDVVSNDFVGDARYDFPQVLRFCMVNRSCLLFLISNAVIDKSSQCPV